MSRIVRKLATFASGLAARVRAWIREMRERLRLRRTCHGFLLALHEHSAPIRPAVCCGCGAAALAVAAPDRALPCWFGRPPELSVGLCELCGAAARRHARFEWIVAGAGAATACLACGLLFLLAPWSGWFWFPLVSLAACSLALGLRLLRPVTFLGRLPVLGVPARWIKRSKGVWTLATSSETLRDLVCGSSPAVSSEPSSVTERYGRALLAVAVLCVLVSPSVWRALHPEVRVINLGPRSVQLFIDGRPRAGSIQPTWSEAPNIGLRVRAPVGSRAFEARDETGVRVDFARGWLGAGDRTLYAPAHQPYCLWIEQRGYGVSGLAGPAALRLPEEESLYRLPFELDAWFQPNPASLSRDRWFSGGVRRTLRFGPCSPAVP